MAAPPLPPSEGDFSSDDDEVGSMTSSSAGSRKRGARRRRGRRTHRTAGSPASEDLNFTEETHRLEAKRRRRTNSVGAPPAPRNTTQFLLQDREVREVQEGELRRRTLSSSEAPSNGEVEESSSSSDGAGGNEFDEEFEEEYREAVLAKYTVMNHDQLAQSMANAEDAIEAQASALQQERRKNARLVEQMRQAGLPLEDLSPRHTAVPAHVHSPPTHPLASPRA